MTPELFEAIKQMYERLTRYRPNDVIKIYASQEARDVLGDSVKIGDVTIPVVVEPQIVDEMLGDGSHQSCLYMCDIANNDTDADRLDHPL